MNIVVCVKQVPDTDDIKWTKENNLDRSNMLSRINEQDEWAIDYAVSIKNKFKDVKISVISMGPMQVIDTLRYTLAKGADDAILLSDKFFSGSDTYVTAKILALGISKYLSGFDLILTGQMASDGDTAQTPVSLAQLLGIVDATNVVEIYNADKNNVLVSQKLASVINMIEISTPCLVAVKNPCKEQTKPLIDDYIRAQDSHIKIIGSEDLSLDKEEIGIKGSPTMVYKAYRPEFVKDAVELKEDYIQQIVDFMVKVNE